MRAAHRAWIRPHGFWIPQRACAQPITCRVPVVTIIAEGDTIAVRQVKLGDATRRQCRIVLGGLNDGDRIVVDGIQKVPARCPRASDQRGCSCRKPRRNLRSNDACRRASSSIARFSCGSRSASCSPAHSRVAHRCRSNNIPAIAPPSLTINVTYPGADAATLETNVTQVIEQELNGIEGLRRMSATSQSNGSASITVTFDSGTDIDVAQMDVQNSCAPSSSGFPRKCRRQGVLVNEASPSFR